MIEVCGKSESINIRRKENKFRRYVCNFTREILHAIRKPYKTLKTGVIFPRNALFLKKPCPQLVFFEFDGVLLVSVPMFFLQISVCFSKERMKSFNSELHELISD